MSLNELRAAVTLLSFLVFVGIVAWTMSRRRRESFDEAARLPFAAGEAGSLLGDRHE
ncbi:cbb3-type cytochrome oxidase subunit 3 [Methylibium sp.]|jgi:cytochrome c oxidase cbb3-type subunit 4|uniref:cbb3-type cytochrome oxidase subunit 3 n=1 Tax=Methylibium sp. TaxID=2067992 RepID=UPI003D13C44B